MRISEKELREIISEAVRSELGRRVNESNGAIDDRFLALANWIVRRAEKGVKKNRWGERAFTIPKNVFAKYNIYDLPFENLRAEVTRGRDFVRGGNRPELGLSDDTLWAKDMGTIAHELTHIVQSKDEKVSLKRNARGHYSLSPKGKEIGHDIAYNFDPAELSARISGAAAQLTGSLYQPKNLRGYIDHKFNGNFKESAARDPENTFRKFYKAVLNYNMSYAFESVSSSLRIYDMEMNLGMLRRDNMRQFNESLAYTLNYYSGKDKYEREPSPVFALLMTRPWYLKKEIPEYETLLGKPESTLSWPAEVRNYRVPQKRETAMWFVVLKGNMLNYFEKAYEEYRRKIDKTLAPRIREIYDAMIRENPDD